MHLDLTNIATPFYLFDEAALDLELEKFQTAIDKFWNNTIISYSVKTNSLPYLASFFQKKGVFAEVVSLDEYELVQLCGYPSSEIVCNGPIKEPAFLERLMSNNAIINIDSHAEVETAISFAKSHPDHSYQIGIRVNIDTEKCFPGESNAGSAGSRFGFSFEQGDLGQIIQRIQTVRNLHIVGLHLHVSTRTRRVEIYQWQVQLFDKIVKAYHLTDISYLDIGGGFYGGVPGKPSWNEYLEGIASELRHLGYNSDTLQLIMEPGVSLVASSLHYYTRIRDCKQTNLGNFALCDGSRIHVDPLFHKDSYFYERLNQSPAISRKTVGEQTLVGFTCLENDRFFSISDSPEFREGDLLRFDKVGAYTNTFSPLFISYFPAVYTLDSKGNLICVREKWTAKEFIQKSHLQ